MAIVFLLLVIILMLLATLGVKDFGDKISKDANITMHPKGEKINL
jgi:hypothetical protein